MIAMVEPTVTEGVITDKVARRVDMTYEGVRARVTDSSRDRLLDCQAIGWLS
jgi:hypothetical protein